MTLSRRGFLSLPRGGGGSRLQQGRAGQHRMGTSGARHAEGLPHSPGDAPTLCFYSILTLQSPFPGCACTRFNLPPAASQAQAAQPASPFSFFLKPFLFRLPFLNLISR